MSLNLKLKAAVDVANASDASHGNLYATSAYALFIKDSSGTSHAITAGALADGDYGDITITSGVWAIDAGVVTATKLASALDLTGKTISVQDSTFSVKDNADATKIAQFQCGTIATATTRTFTFPDASGTIALSSDLSSYQPLDATLTALAGANWAANALPIGTGADALSQTSFAANTFPARASTGNLVAKTITDFGLSLVDDTDAAAARTTLGLGTLATQSGTFSGTSSGTNTGDQNLFATISVSGQSDVAADAAADTLTLAAGSGVTITTNATTDTITISATGSGGTVTATGGALTSNAVVLGAGSADTKVVAGISTDGASKVNLGVAGSSVGAVVLANATSGSITVQPPTGALGTVTVTVPAATDTLVGKATTDTLTNKTLTSPKVGTAILDTNGNELFNVTATASAVNELTYANAATGGVPTFTASGGDTNVSIDLVPKGTHITDSTVRYNGTEVGFRAIPQNSQSTAYTTVAADRGKHILHPAADTNARTFTIDSNANVAYPIGTAITFVNETSQVVTIAITSDTLTLAGTTTTGSRSLAQNGVATALKITSTKWIISGTGLS